MDARRRRPRCCDLITSANVACGFHAGDPSIMRRVCEMAVENGVSRSAPTCRIPTSPASVDGSSTSIRTSCAMLVVYQLGALDGFAQVAGTGVDVREAPRRALQHHGRRRGAGRGGRRARRASTTRRCRARAARARAARAPPTRPGSRPSPRPSPTGPTWPMARWCRAREPDSVLTDPAVVAARAVRLATEHEVVAIDGTVVAVRCPVDLHPRRHAGAVQLAQAVRAGLESRRRRHLSVHGVSRR